MSCLCRVMIFSFMLTCRMFVVVKSWWALCLCLGFMHALYCCLACVDTLCQAPSCWLLVLFMPFGNAWNAFYRFYCNLCHALTSVMPSQAPVLSGAFIHTCICFMYLAYLCRHCVMLLNLFHMYTKLCWWCLQLALCLMYLQVLSVCMPLCDLCLYYAIIAFLGFICFNWFSLFVFGHTWSSRLSDSAIPR